MGISQVSYEAMLDELESIKEAAQLVMTPDEAAGAHIGSRKRSHGTMGAILGAGGGALIGNMAAKALGKDRALGTLIGSLGGNLAGTAGGYHLGGSRGRKEWRDIEKKHNVPEKYRANID